MPSPMNLAVTSTFDLLVSKCNHFIPVPDCILVIHLMKFLQVVCSAFIIFGPTVTLTFDLLISKSNPFIFVPDCT